MNFNSSKPKGNSWALFLAVLEKLACLPNFLLASLFLGNELYSNGEQICEYVYPVECEAIRIIKEFCQ